MLLALVELLAALCLALALVRRATPPKSLLLPGALSLLLGLGLWSAGYIGVRLAGAGPGLASAIAAVELAAAAWLSRGRERLAPAASAGEAPRALRLAFAACLAVALTAITEHVLRLPDGAWDGWMLWTSKARFLFRAGDDVTPMFSPALAEAQFRTHPDYPLLLPGLVAQGFALAGGESPWVPALLSVLFAALCVALLLALLRELRGPRAALVAACALLTTPVLIPLAAAQCADVPLAAFVLAATGCLLLAARDPAMASRWLLIGGLFAGLAAFIKNEGIACFAALTLSLVAFPAGLRSRARWRERSCWLLGAAPALALLVWFKLSFAPPNDLAQVPPGAALARVFDWARLAQVALAIARRLVYFQDWALHLLGAAALLVSLLLRRGRAALGAVKPAAAAVALIFAADALALLVTPHELAWQLKSLDRLIFQCWPATLLWLSLLPEARGLEPPLEAVGLARPVAPVLLQSARR